jgi:TetR/AcrR family transcriptional regulator
MTSIAKKSRGHSERSRLAILDAASAEFSNQGIAGARIDSIAKAAGVNKALLYYYFRDKEGLYGAALEHTFGGLLEQLVRILDTDRTAGYKILAYALTHFNHVASHPHYRRLVQHEMMRAGAGETRHFQKLVQNFFRPLLARVTGVLEAGIVGGEFRRVETMQFVHSMIAVVVFYFTAAPVLRAIGGYDPFSDEALDRRRRAMLDFISGALFVSQAHASRVVDEVIENISAPVASKKVELHKPPSSRRQPSTAPTTSKEVQ